MSARFLQNVISNHLHIAVFILFSFKTNYSSAVNQSGSVEDVFRQCLVSRSPALGALGYCLGFGALSKLRSIDEDPRHEIVDGLMFVRDEKMFRDGNSILEGREPSDYKGIFSSMEQIFSQGSLQWDMGFMYPGLGLRVAPSTTPSMLEFVMDPQSIAKTTIKEPSTSRILAKQYLLPFLLGFKFNIASLIPIVFGILALIAKKALFFSKVALILSSSLALGSIVFPGFIGSAYGGGGGGYGCSGSQHGGSYGYGGGGGSPFNPGFGGASGGSQHYRYPEEQYASSGYEGYFGGIEKSNKNEDQLNLYGDIRDLQEAAGSIREDNTGSGRNFAWNENDKKSYRKK